MGEIYIWIGNDYPGPRARHKLMKNGDPLIVIETFERAAEITNMFSGETGICLYEKDLERGMILLTRGSK